MYPVLSTITACGFSNWYNLGITFILYAQNQKIGTVRTCLTVKKKQRTDLSIIAEIGATVSHIMAVLLWLVMLSTIILVDVRQYRDMFWLYRWPLLFEVMRAFDCNVDHCCLGSRELLFVSLTIAVWGLCIAVIGYFVDH